MQHVFPVTIEIPTDHPAAPIPGYLARVAEAHSLLRLATERLRLLLGADHELVRLCEGAQEAVWDTFRIESYGASASDVGEQNFSSLMTAGEAFAQAAKSAVGALLPSTE